MPWRSAGVIAGLWLVGSLVAAQKPAPGPIAVQLPDAQAQPAAATRVEELEARLKQLDEAIRTNDLEWIEADERLRQRREDVGELDALRLFFFFTTGSVASLSGERSEDDDTAALTEMRHRERIQDEGDVLRRTRDTVARELSAMVDPSPGGTLLEFLDTEDVAPSLGLSTNDPTPSLVTVHATTPVVMVPAEADGVQIDRVTIFTTGPPTGEPPVIAWVELQQHADHVPASGPIQLRRSGDTYSFVGVWGDWTAGVYGDFRPDLRSSGSEFSESGRGIGQVKIVTPKAIYEFRGPAFFADQRDTRNANPSSGAAGSNINPTALPREPALILTTPGVGGPVIRDTQFFFFDAKGAKVGEGTGVWGYDGGSRLTYTSDAASHYLNLTLDYEANRATWELNSRWRLAAAFVPESNAWSAGKSEEGVRIDVENLVTRTPYFLFGSDARTDPSRWDDVEMETAIQHLAARYRAAVGTPRARPAAEPDLPGSSPLEMRLGFGRDPLGEAHYMSGSSVLSGDQLNVSELKTLSPDPGTQRAGARLVITSHGRAHDVVPLLARRADDAVRASLVRWHPQPPTPRRADRAAARQQQRAASAPPTVYFRSLGRSTGPEAIEMTWVGDAPLPASVDNLLVLEPIAPAEGRRVERQMAEASRGRAVVMKLAMYCLNQRLATPAPGQIMRLASTATHREFVHVVAIWDAADRARDEGTLRPDSDPQDYYHSIVQWAIWTKEQGFDEGSFGVAFTQHTRKNLESAGHKWSPQIEDVVRGIVANRWHDVQQVLKAAGL